MTIAIKLKTLAPWKKSYEQPRQHIEKQRHYFADKSSASQSYSFSNSHVWMWELDYKESWTQKNRCFELWCWRLLRVPWTAQRSNCQHLLDHWKAREFQKNIHFCFIDYTNKGPSSQSCRFSSSYVWIWESWVPKNWCFWTVVLEKTLESFGLQGDQTSQS